METLTTLIDSGADLATIAKHLNGLTGDKRNWEVCELGKARQVKLWAIAGSKPHPMDLGWLMPKDAKPYQPYPFDGKNSLPLYKRFQKVFYKCKDGSIAGFNNSPASWITGPGYYVTEMFSGRDGDVGVNYQKVPGTKPEGWPAIRPNTAFPTNFIYGGMIDYLRWVSEDVCIGRAYRNGTSPTPNYFMLARTDRIK